MFDYVEKHPEERQYWLYKVRGLADLCATAHDAATRLEGQLWMYYIERAGVIPAFKEFRKAQCGARTSMKNLAEYLLRSWTTPKPKNPSV